MPWSSKSIAAFGSGRSGRLTRARGRLPARKWRRASRASDSLRSVAKSIWHWLVIVISGPGLGEEYKAIDETAMPSGFVVPYKRGSRQVRNLSHLLF